MTSDPCYAPLSGPAESAARRAAELARGRALESATQDRVPIAGAVVTYDDATGAMHDIATGVNGRVPDPTDVAAAGYPTDHGETATVRALGERIDAVDWSRTVFATTLSPCVMCARTLEVLWARGLRRLVVLESVHFPGRQDLLVRLDGMQIVEPSPAPRDLLDAMDGFSTRFPEVWSADIGELPIDEEARAAARRCVRERSRRRELIAALRAAVPDGPAAAVFGPDGTRLGHALDGRPEPSDRRGNPTHAAGIRALGEAGSAARLRECVVVLRTGARDPIDVDGIGRASLGALELFRPAELVVDRPLAAPLGRRLADAGVPVTIDGDG